MGVGRFLTFPIQRDFPDSSCLETYKRIKVPAGRGPEGSVLQRVIIALRADHNPSVASPSLDSLHPSSTCQAKPNSSPRCFHLRFNVSTFQTSRSSRNYAQRTSTRPTFLRQLPKTTKASRPSDILRSHLHPLSLKHPKASARTFRDLVHPRRRQVLLTVLTETSSHEASLHFILALCVKAGYRLQIKNPCIPSFGVVGFAAVRHFSVSSCGWSKVTARPGPRSLGSFGRNAVQQLCSLELPIPQILALHLELTNFVRLILFLSLQSWNSKIYAGCLLGKLLLSICRVKCCSHCLLLLFLSRAPWSAYRCRSQVRRDEKTKRRRRRCCTANWCKVKHGKPRHSEVEQQEEGQRSTVTAIH